MIALRLVDARTGEALAHAFRNFRTLDTAYAGLKRERNWKRGGLAMDDMPGSGPRFHVWAEAYNQSGVLARWIWMELRTIQSIVGPGGRALPGSDRITQRDMAWIGVTEDVARWLMEGETPEVQPEPHAGANGGGDGA